MVDPPSTAPREDEETVGLVSLFVLKSFASKDGSWSRLVRLVEQDRRFGQQIAQRLGGVAWEGILRGGTLREIGVPRDDAPFIDAEDADG